MLYVAPVTSAHTYTLILVSESLKLISMLICHLCDFNPCCTTYACIAELLSKVADADAKTMKAMMKEVYEKVLQKRKQGLEMKNHAHLDTKPVCLILVPQYKNMKHACKTGQLLPVIDSDFKHMSKSDYEFHSLKDFYEPAATGKGYVYKKLNDGARMFDLDHLLPDSWSGIDHPRNYVMMHRSYNRSFADATPEHKLAYIGNRNGATALRLCAAFHKQIKDDKAVKAAHNDFFQHRMPML
jgi:hypothetical protein